MGDANKRMENLPLQVNTFPRDLLQRFMEGSSSSSSRKTLTESKFQVVKEEELESTEIELNLGLSLGGRFGVEKSANSLARSSSIAGPMQIHIFNDDEGLLAPAVLARTASLPVETEDEWRKRKEMQSLRRMEAKRRRSEKQRVVKGENVTGGGEIEVNLRGRMERDQYVSAMNRVGSSVAPQFGFPMWVAGASQAILGGGGGSVQGSIESKAGSSSSMSELDSKALQGSTSCGEASPASIQSVQEQTYIDIPAGSSGAKSRENVSAAKTESQSNSCDVSRNRANGTGTNSLGDMPSVFTKGNGPNGRRIEGILYKYGKGEEVRIMCVCHGSFHSPAEFVKHAGGIDVAHPLKHIVVNPNSSPQ
ncbi:hypothetical protein LguiB_024988 [Lonicera macranthoides]